MNKIQTLWWTLIRIKQGLQKVPQRIPKIQIFSSDGIPNSDGDTDVDLHDDENYDSNAIDVNNDGNTVDLYDDNGEN